jgi:glycosyltransferase involved in cell wall biosynthesis
MDRIKLLKFINLFAVGGTERQFVSLGQSLDPSIFDLHMACFRAQGQYLEEIRSRRIPLEVFSTGKLYQPKAFQEQFRLARHLRRQQIQIVHTYSFYPNVFAIPAARWAGVPVVVASIRDTGAYLTPMKQRVQRWVCRMADRVLVNADAVKEWLVRDGYDANKISVIRNGVDLARFSSAAPAAEIRRGLGVPADAPLVGVLSRLSDVKGVDYFLEAAAIVARQRPDARFVIVGDAAVEKDRAYARSLLAYATELGLDGRVIFAGFRLDIPEVLSTLSVLALPSLSEGLSNAALESMAAALPVVATRVGGSPEAVEDGVTGFLVPPRNSAALARAIVRLLEDRNLASSFGQAGRRRVEREFSLTGMVRRTEEFYLRLLQKADLKNSGHPESDRLPGSPERVGGSSI